jgi:2-polyprenyl-3-methyl-5-hydroxy-6-metoxy-1,4-benzoquinol methylase
MCNCIEFINLFTAKGFNVIQCSKCNLVQIKESPSEEELKKTYSIGFFEKGKFSDDIAFQLESNRRIKLINTIPDAYKLRILDYGCATGDFMKNCDDIFDISGVDYSEQAIMKAKELYPHKKNKFYNLYEKSLYKQKFNIVVGWDMIEHANNPKDTITDMINLIDGDGYIILSTPNFDTLIAKVLKDKWAFMIPPEHISFFSRETLEYLFKDHHYKTINWSTRGKWVNLAFLSYKFRQAFGIIPQSVVEFFKSSFLRKLSVYIPTGDIQYIIVKIKKEV